MGSGLARESFPDHDSVDAAKGKAVFDKGVDAGGPVGLNMVKASAVRPCRSQILRPDDDVLGDHFENCC